MGYKFVFRSVMHVACEHPNLPYSNNSERLQSKKEADELDQEASSEDMIGDFSREQLLDPVVHLEHVPTIQLHSLLKSVDPETADMLHPNERRKILRCYDRGRFQCLFVSLLVMSLS